MALTFTFNCKSLNFLRVKTSNHLDRAKKNIELVTIPGRTGCLILDDGTCENLTLNIECYVDGINSGKSFKEMADELEAWLLTPVGYQDLIFSDGTRLKAVFVGDISLNPLIRNFKQITLQFSAYKEC